MNWLTEKVSGLILWTVAWKTFFTSISLNSVHFNSRRTIYFPINIHKFNCHLGKLHKEFLIQIAYRSFVHLIFILRIFSTKLHKFTQSLRTSHGTAWLEIKKQVVITGSPVFSIHIFLPLRSQSNFFHPNLQISPQDYKNSLLQLNQLRKNSHSITSHSTRDSAVGGSE